MSTEATSTLDGAPRKTDYGLGRLTAGIQSVLHRHPSLSPFVVLVVSALVFGAINPRFFNPANLSILLQQVAVIGLLSLGQTIIILTAGIDLAVGAAMILAQMVMASVAIESGWPAPLALLAGFVVALATGALDGILVTKFNVPPFIGTLGTLGIFTAIGLLYASGQTVTPPPDSMLLWAGVVITLGPFNITVGVLIMLAMYIIVGFMLGKTTWGKHVYAVGDSPESARLVGIRTRRLLFSVYLLAGLIYGIAAFVQIGRVGNASTDISSTLNLDSITAAVIGGVSLFGALIVQVFQDGLALAGVQDLYQGLAEGLLVIFAVAIDQWIRRVRK